METLNLNETVLAPGCIDSEVKNGCVDDTIEIGAIGKTDQAVYKAFKDILYDQLNVDPYSCFVVGPYTCLSNLTGKTVPYQTMINTLARLAQDGKFTHGFGGKLSDGVQYATEDFNRLFGTNIKFSAIGLNELEIMEALASGSPIATGIKYGSEYFANEQDDGIIQELNGTTGNHGHCISFIKGNTTDKSLGLQIKYAENYIEHLKYNIIYANFTKLRALFFNGGFKFTL